MYLTISNPSPVDAWWELSKDKHASDTRMRNNNDSLSLVQIGCFSLHPTSGTLRGKTLGKEYTQKIRVEFSPSEGSSCEMVHVLCWKGRGCSIALNGQGSVNEALESDGILYRL